MSRFNALKTELTAQPATWLITGVAGFIGSNLLEHLLKLGQNVVCCGRMKIDQFMRVVPNEN